MLRDGTILTQRGGNYTYTHNGVTHTLTGITFDRTTGQLDITGFTITPPNPDIAALDLAIRATTQIHGLNLFKDKNVTINLPHVAPLDVLRRQYELCAYNTRGGGVLQRILNTTYDMQHETMEREALFAILRRNDPSNKLDSLTPDQQQEAYRVLRALYTPLGWDLGRASMVHYAGANSFESWFTHNDHPGSALPHNRDERSYTDYIHSHHPQEIQRYMR